MTHPRTGILLANLGTPHLPTRKHVHQYLTEFLTDKRVVDLPWLWKNLLVRFFIIPRRYKQSTEYYKKIWTEEGSPLLVYGEKIRALLQMRMGPAFRVELGMRYQMPSIKSALADLLNNRLEEIIVLPLFPQYASATTGSIHECIMQELKVQLHIPKITFINNFAADPGFIAAFRAVAEGFDISSYDHILFSFHGLPQRQIKKMDSKNSCLKSKDCCLQLTSRNHFCYSAQCFATAHSISDSLKLPRDKYSISFQSRLGKEAWLEPYTNERIKELAKTGQKKILVFCPSFVCDCLETTYEIGVEYAQEFRQAGGHILDLVPGLNDHPKWIDALEKLVLNHNK